MHYAHSGWLTQNTADPAQFVSVGSTEDGAVRYVPPTHSPSGSSEELGQLLVSRSYSVKCLKSFLGEAGSPREEFPIQALMYTLFIFLFKQAAPNNRFCQA